MRILSLLLLLTLAGCASQPRLRPFTTDGCSLFPDGTSEHKDLWLDCCKKHDHKYWMGGTKAERLQADIELRNCVAGVGEPRTAELMLQGVRAGGTPYLPTRFRWGYGWRYFRGYKPLTDKEKKLIEDSK
ncbi:MAG: hypothetical protein NTY77_10880 [Elusimicrobia bacterium]|nr:hypothetical protein [Elusimicrobiota bacterium]